MRILTLFLTSGKSLTSWQRDGILSREILVYRELLANGVFDRVQVFSYNAADRDFVVERAKGERFYTQIDVLTPDTGWKGARWGIEGVLKHRKAIAQSAALKTNQVSGAWAAWLAARLTGVPLVFRMGYILSRRFTLNGEMAKAAAARLIERLAARRAKRIVVTSADAAEHFRRDTALRDKVIHLPTYVDTTMFAAAGGFNPAGPAIAVARMRPQKNLIELLHACALVDCPLTLVGKGEQQAELRALVANLPVKVTFIEHIDNAELPALLSQHDLFLLPSLHEGLPKVLIEAMAAGLVCVGSTIPGVTDLIRDGETGFLIDGFDREAIAATIRRARAEGGVRATGAAARALIERRYGLGIYAQAEGAVFREVMA